MFKAEGRSLSEFNQLRPAEIKLLEFCKKGEIAQVNLMGFRPAQRTEDNFVHAAFVRFLILGGDDDAPVHEKGVQLQGAWIVGGLDLEGAILSHNVELKNCWIDGEIVLRHCKARTISLEGSRIAGLEGDGSQIEGDLLLRNGFLAEGKVRCVVAQVKGYLSCSRGQFNNAKGVALEFDGATIQGNVNLRRDFSAQGEIRFVGANIADNLDCGTGRITNPADVALNFDGARIRGSVYLKKFSAEGEVRLANATIGGHLDCRNAKLAKQSNAQTAYAHALVFDGAEIGAVVFLSDGFSAEGVVRLHGARIKGDLMCERGRFIGAPMQDLTKRMDKSHIALSMNRARVEGRFFLRQLAEIFGNVSLAHAHVGVLFDDKDLIKKISTDNASRFYLDGFTYDRLHSAAPVDWAIRLKWLESQPKKHIDKEYKETFRPQPWDQLIKVLRAMGHIEQARKIAIAKEKHVFKIGKGIWYTRLGHWVYGKLAGYGHRPSWLFAWMCGIWLACGVFYYWAASEGVFGPSDPRIFNNPKLAHCRPNAQDVPIVQKQDGPVEEKHKGGNWWVCPDLPREYTSFSPFVYSLDLILPVVSLDQAKNWRPITLPADRGNATRWIIVSMVLDVWSMVLDLFYVINSFMRGVINYMAIGAWGLPNWPEHMGLFVRLVTWLENLFGWAASLLMVATLSGLVKKDEA